MPGYTEDEHAVRELPGRRDRRRAVTPPVAGRPPESAAGAPGDVLIRFWDRWVDRFAGSDPGLNRLRMALQGVLTIQCRLGAEGLFIHFTQALHIQTHGAVLPAAAAAKVAAADHGFLVIAMLIGAIVGLISSLRRHGQDRPGPAGHHAVAARPAGCGADPGARIGGHRILALVCLPVIVAVGTYCRRFGPRGSIAGMAAVHWLLHRFPHCTAFHAG